MNKLLCHKLKFPEPKLETIVTTYTVHDLNCHTFFEKKTSKKCDNLGTFTQKVAILDYNKTKKEKSGTIWKKI